jgi:hypothetical protein
MRIGTIYQKDKPPEDSNQKRVRDGKIHPSVVEA